MKIYNNKFTKKILIGLTTITLLTNNSAMSEVKYSNNPPIYTTSSNITINSFDNHLELINKYTSILEKNSTNNFINPYNKESSKYLNRTKVLTYLANYEYINNTDLEQILREFKIVDTYTIDNEFGINLDINEANSITSDLVTYNFNCFTNIEQNDYSEEIIKRKIDITNIDNMINPSIFLMNELDKEYVNNCFNILIKLINYCNNNDFENMRKCLLEYFNYQNNNNVNNSTKWLNNVTNNALCIRILETYIIEHYYNQINDILVSYDEESLLFIGEIDEDSETYDASHINLDNVTDYNLRLLLACDKKLHIDTYTNSNDYLLESINENIKTNEYQKKTIK